MSEAQKKQKNNLIDKISKPKPKTAQRAFLQQFDDLEESIEEKATKERLNTAKKDKPKTKKVTKETLREEQPTIEAMDDTLTKTDDAFWEKLKNSEGLVVRNEKVPTTFLLEEDLSEIVEALADREGRGFKNKFYNEAIRYTLKSKGLI